MTINDAYRLIQQGGTLVAVMFAVWALVTRRVITRGEFDKLEASYQDLKKSGDLAIDELRRQAATNAKLVELAFQQRQEAESIRKDAAKGS